MPSDGWPRGSLAPASQMHALQARKRTAALRGARLDITIKIRWCPAQGGCRGQTRCRRTRHPWDGITRVFGPGGVGHNAAPQVSRTPQERDFGEEVGRTPGNKYRMPSRQKSDNTAAGSSDRLASRFYQLKTGHCLTGQYLQWTRNRPTAQYWWCRYRAQTRGHLLKAYPQRKAQQKIPWAEVREESGRGKSRFKVRNLLAQPGGTRLPLRHGCGWSRLRKTRGSKVSEWERGERGEREEQHGVEAEELGAGERRYTTVSAHTLFHGVCGGGVGDGHAFLCSPLGSTPPALC